MNAYVQELIADIIANGESDLDITIALARAHDRRKAFANEILEGDTVRAELFTRTLMTETYSAVRSEEAMSKNFRACESIYNASNP